MVAALSPCQFGRALHVDTGEIPANTTFADSSSTDETVRAAISKKKQQLAISPDAIARAIAFAVEQPGDVEVGSIVIRPTAQD